MLGRVRIAPTVRHIVLPASLVAVWTAMLVSGTGWADRWILLQANLSGHPDWRYIATLVTHLGGWKLLTALTLGAAAVLVLRQRYKDAAVVIATILVGRLLVELQKLAFERPRPDALLRLVEVDSFSFPSGHAANSMIACLAIAMALASASKWRGYALAMALALSAAIGLTRVLLGVHWPSDVVAGWSFGILWIVFVRHCGHFDGRPKLIDDAIV